MQCDAITVAVAAHTKTTSACLLCRFATGTCFWRHEVIRTLTLTKSAPSNPPNAPKPANKGTSQKYHQNTRE